ncbi:N-acetylglucosamine-6-phosphate deacetylase-like [Ptychodera flava]|uniref:N-acetylglucosamine-6-phosphate deacetylase-like n=1 Tax=Ptychodera flava TaxID=63121 RepID=UPI00396A5D29
MITCISCNQLVLPGGKLREGDLRILIENDIIKDIIIGENESTKAAEKHYSAALVTPGFIDIHHHGMGGDRDLVNFWKNPEYSQKRFPEYGVTSFLATMVYPRDAKSAGTFETIETVERIVGKTDGNPGAVCEGINGEGPIVNDFGGLPESEVEMPIPEFRALLDMMPSCKIMTISPRIDAKSGYQRIKLLLERGIVPSLGHDRAATQEEILGALRLQPSTQFHITHLFNVCSFHHRTPSLVNFGLTEDFPSLPEYEGLQPPTVEVIGDLRHVHAMTISTLLKARHFSNVAFISDCTAKPEPGAEIIYNSRKMQVSEDGKCLFISGTKTLAGSCCSVMDAFRSLVKVLNVDVAQAAAMVSETPAKIAKLDHIGKIEPNKRADLLLFDGDLILQKTLVAGKVVYSKD